MEKTIDISVGVLRTIVENEKFFERYFLPCGDNDRLSWFLSSLCRESSFLNSNNRYSFQDEIMALSDLCRIELTKNQIKILSDLIGNFQHQSKQPVSIERLYALDDIFILRLVDLLISKEVGLDTHIAVRADLRLYESVHEILPYDKYKELVFSTICRITRCSSGDFNPMAKVKNKVWLKNEDYKQLCSEIFK